MALAAALAFAHAAWGAGEGPSAGDDWAATLRLAPIRAWGSAGYELRMQDGDAQGRSMSQMLTARVDAASFIWQPWFATVKAGAGVTTAWTRVDEERAGSRDLFVSGRGQLDLFPGSRFPFEAHVDVTDTRADSTLAALPPARWTRLGFSQSWRPANGAYSLSGSYDHATQSSASGADTQDTINLGTDVRWKDSNLAVTTSFNRNAREQTLEETRFGSLVARHGWQPAPALSFESTANLAFNRYRLRGGETDNAVVQLGSVGFWRPAREPYTVAGSARYFESDTDGRPARSANLTLGGNYDATSSLRFSASAGLGFLDAGSGAQTLHAASAGAAYQGKTLELDAYRYDWNASASAAYSGASGDRGDAGDERDRGDAGDQRNLGAASVALGHALGRTFALANGSSIATVVGQAVTAGVGTGQRSESDDFVRLGTTASIGWMAGGSGIAGYARLSLDDSRDLLGEGGVFQMANLQVSGTWDLSRYAQLSGDLTAQWVRSRNARRDPLEPGSLGTPASSAATTGLGASIVYRHQRVFGVPRLRFVSDLRITNDAVVEQERRDLMPSRETRSWENRLDYRVGRLLVTFGVRVSDVNRDRVRLLLLRIQRDFDGVAGR